MQQAEAASAVSMQGVMSQSMYAQVLLCLLLLRFEHCITDHMQTTSVPTHVNRTGNWQAQQCCKPTASKLQLKALLSQPPDAQSQDTHSKM